MPSAVHDFDFLLGTWRVVHRRLKDRLVGSQAWETFSGSTTFQKILGGMGNMDDNVLELPSGTYCALSLRTFDPVSSSWSIWWLDGRIPGSLDKPVVGGFEDDVGTFFAVDALNGMPIRVRFRWTDTQTTTPHWEQAFSADDGVEWETNWTMDFFRTA